MATIRSQAMSLLQTNGWKVIRGNGSRWSCYSKEGWSKVIYVKSRSIRVGRTMADSRPFTLERLKSLLNTKPVQESKPPMTYVDEMIAAIGVDDALRVLSLM